MLANTAIFFTNNLFEAVVYQQHVDVRTDHHIPDATPSGGSLVDVVVAVAVERALDGDVEAPGALASCANPTDGGVARNTEYTFFYLTPISRAALVALSAAQRTKKVSPTIHLGVPPRSNWRLRSKMAPTQKSGIDVRRIMSSLLIGHARPPKLIVTFSCAVHAGGTHRTKNVSSPRSLPRSAHVRITKNPAFSPRKGRASGTLAQNLVTSPVGPPIRVVPVSITESDVDRAIETFRPFTVNPVPTTHTHTSINVHQNGKFRKNVPVICNNQNPGTYPTGISVYSISPVYSELFVPPSVITPPGSSSLALVSFTNRVR